MKIRDHIKNLFEFLLQSRRSGTTTLLKKIADVNNVWVLVPNFEMKQEFGKCGITLEELKEVRGYQTKPILLDNYTLLELTESTLQEFKTLDEYINHLSNLTKNIKNMINEFEQKHNTHF